MVQSAQLTGYVMAVFLCLLVVVSMLLNLYDFGANCLLFTVGDYGEGGEFVAAWASPGYCVYVIVTAMAAGALCVHLGRKTFKQLRCDLTPSFAETLCDLLMCALITSIALVAAFFITFGYREWCKNITKRFATCSDATRDHFSTGENINTRHFHIEIGVAQFGCWCLWSFLVGLCVLLVVKLCKSHQDENIRSSMSRQRQRLMRGAGGGHSRLIEQLD